MASVGVAAVRASDPSILSDVKSGKYRFGKCFECSVHSFQHMSYVCSVHVARNSDHKPLVQDVQRQLCQETSGPSCSRRSSLHFRLVCEQRQFLVAPEYSKYACVQGLQVSAIF